MLAPWRSGSSRRVDVLGSWPVSTYDPSDEHVEVDALVLPGMFNDEFRFHSLYTALLDKHVKSARDTLGYAVPLATRSCSSPGATSTLGTGSSQTQTSLKRWRRSTASALFGPKSCRGEDRSSHFQQPSASLESSDPGCTTLCSLSLAPWSSVSIG